MYHLPDERPSRVHFPAGKHNTFVTFSQEFSVENKKAKANVKQEKEANKQAGRARRKEGRNTSSSLAGWLAVCLSACSFIVFRILF